MVLVVVRDAVHLIDDSLVHTQTELNFRLNHERSYSNLEEEPSCEQNDVGVRVVDSLEQDRRQIPLVDHSLVVNYKSIVLDVSDLL